MCANGSGRSRPSWITRMSPVSFSAKNSRPSGANAMFEGKDRSLATSSGLLDAANDVAGASIPANHARRMMDEIRRVTIRVSHGCSLELMDDCSRGSVIQH